MSNDIKKNDSNSLLEYENQIYLDMYHNDALLIMAEGLGIERIFTNFINVYSDPSCLVLILNTNEAEEEYFIDQFKRRKLNHLPIKITNETHSVNERAQVYQEGGCFFITSRILVVDMLTDRIPIELITGILVYKAHKIIDSCQESFILRMFRQKNKKGFIKAFSDNPIYFTRSSSKVNIIMKNLFVKKLFIYPRFHVDIESELTKYQANVVEIHVSLSENSSRTQMALLDILNVLLQEFKGCCTYIDHDYLTMEMVISKPFDQVVKSQLEPVWNHLGTKPKQLINDIKTLRLLLYYLTQYDCITFHKMLNALRSHEKDLGRSSGWMFLDAANELFTRAKLRVYGNSTNLKHYSKADWAKKENIKAIIKQKREMAERVIEESPKLKALKEILEELALEENTKDGNIDILIVSNDDRTSSQIKHFLRKNKLTSHDKKAKSKSKTSKKAIKYDKFDIIHDENGDDDTNNKNDDEDFIVKMILKPICQGDLNTNNLDDEIIKNSETAKLLKKAKKNEKKLEQKTTLTQMVKSKGQTTNAGKNKKTEASSSSESSSNESLSSSSDTSSSDASDDEKIVSDLPDIDKVKGSTNFKTNLYLSAFEGGPKQRLLLLNILYDIKPTYIILYDSQLWFVRTLEIYKTINFDMNMRFYFLMYTNSCEEQKYLTSIRSEKESFEILIKQKATMIVLEEQDGKIDLTLDEKDKEKETIKSIINSRVGGLQNQQQEDTDQTMKVIVDMREFRSELPSILHKRGFNIEPVTLEVGDYVLTPNICVERKSINDLIESLSNGRLYNQCNAMSRSYKTPILLIEFDRNKPFLLNSYQPMSTDINSQHISSKLVLLTMNFPKLRILWCSSPSETAEIFEELKNGCPEPDTALAMSIKTDEVIEDENVRYNPVLIDILLRIPGINSKNINRVLTKVTDLCDLCTKSEDELSEILENSKSAKLVYEFLNKSKKDDNDFMNELDFEDVKDFYKGTSKKSKISSSSNLSGQPTTSSANVDNNKKSVFKPKRPKKAATNYKKK